MPRYAIVLSYDDGLVERAAEVWRLAGATCSSLGGAHVHLRGPQGQTFLMYEWSLTSEDRADLVPGSVAEGVAMPDLARVRAFIAECCDARWFIELVSRLAAGSRESLWVLDSGDRLWHAGAIDPEGLRL